MSAMAVKPRIDFDRALSAADPVRALRAAVALELAHGIDRAELYDALDEARLGLREVGRDKDEDVVADVMDFLTDYCSPHARL